MLISGAVGPGEHEKDKSSIWLVSILGGKPRRLRDDAFRAELSPDDSLVAYMRRHESIMVADADGNDPRVFIERQDWHLVGSPTWSSDSKRVVYKRVALDRGVTTIESRGLDEATSVVLVRDEGRADPDVIWGKDFLMLEDRLVYVKGEPAPRHREENLWEIAVDTETAEPTGEPTRLTNWAGFRIGGLSATFDGSKLVFGKDSTQSDVYVGELTDRGRKLDNPRRLTLDDRDDVPWCWAPDGSAVVFQSDRYGNADLFVQELGQRNARDLVTGAKDQVEPSLTPDGTSFLYWQSQENAGGPTDSRQLLRIPVGGGPTELVLDATGWAWSRCATRPDGPCLLSEIRVAEGALAVSRLDSLNGRGEELWRVQLDPSVTPQASLSPDGRQLAMVGHVKHSPTIRFLESATGNVVRDLDAKGVPGLEFYGVAWSADGNGLYLHGQWPTGVALVHVDLQGRAHVLHEDKTSDFSSVVPSPDGRHLAFGKTTWDTNVWMVEGF